MGDAAGLRGLEREPAADDAVLLRGVIDDGHVRGRVRRRGIGEPGLQHGADRRATLASGDIPGKGQQITPIAGFAEERGHTRDVPRLEGLAEGRYPAFHLCPRVSHALPPRIGGFCAAYA
jgi:hypothetical protein